MRFEEPLIKTRFLRREKRFFVYTLAADGTELVAHTNNTGRMSGCLVPGGVVWLSPAQNPARKLKWSLEITESEAGTLVGVNTALANRLVAEAITAGLLPQLSGWPEMRSEVPYGSRNSRIDHCLINGDSKVWVEVKNLSLVVQGAGRFPDAPSERGRKHLAELMEMVEKGDRAALVFCSQRADTRTVGPADDIDPAYGSLLREAHECGVEIYGLGCAVSPTEIICDRVLTVDLGPSTL